MTAGRLYPSVSRTHPAGIRVNAEQNALGGSRANLKSEVSLLNRGLGWGLGRRGRGSCGHRVSRMLITPLDSLRSSVVVVLFSRTASSVTSRKVEVVKIQTQIVSKWPRKATL